MTRSKITTKTTGTKAKQSKKSSAGVSGVKTSAGKRSESKRLPPRHPAWNIWQGLFLVALVILIEWPLGWLETPKDVDTTEGLLHFVSVGIGEAALYLAIIFLFFRLLHRPISDLGFVEARWRHLFLGVIVGIFLFVSVGALGNLLSRWIGTPAPQSFALAVDGVSYNWEFVMLLILGGIVAPLKEETLFRGLIYAPLRETYGPGKGIIFTGLFFATLHLDLVRFLPLFVGGVILTWLYERTSSIWPSIVAHGTWNILMALALWIQRY